MPKRRLSDVYLDPDRDMARHLDFDLGHVAKAIGKARGDAAPGAFAREEAQAAILAVTALQRRNKTDKRYFMASKNAIRTPGGATIELKKGALYRLRSGAHARYLGADAGDPWIPRVHDQRFEIVTGKNAGRAIAVRFDGTHCDPDDAWGEPTEFDVVGVVR